MHDREISMLMKAYEDCCTAMIAPFKERGDHYVDLDLVKAAF
jgi:hypothetical protein